MDDAEQVPPAMPDGVTWVGDRSPTFGRVALALAKAQGAYNVVDKDRTNPHFGQAYATLDAVLSGVRPALSAHGIAILQPPRTGAGAEVSVRTVLVHESGEWFACDLSAKARDVGPQAIGSVITYLRRYGLMGLAGVAPAQDDDGNAATVGMPAVSEPAPVVTRHKRSESAAEAKPDAPPVVTVKVDKAAESVAPIDVVRAELAKRRIAESDFATFWTSVAPAFAWPNAGEPWPHKPDLIANLAKRVQEPTGLDAYNTWADKRTS